MSDQQQNPFSSYSLEEQNYYADQMRSALASGKLNPAQTQGVTNALKYLPMSKSAADANLQNLATHGQGTWQPQPTPKYNPSPQGARRAIIAQYLSSPQAGPSFEGGAGEMAIEGLGHLGEIGGEVGGSVAALPFAKGSTAQGVARATGKFIGSTVSDPINLSMMAAAPVSPLMKSIVGLGFAGKIGKDTVQQAGEIGSRWDEMSRSEKAESLTTLGLGAVTAGASGAHGIKSLRPSYAPVETPSTPAKPVDSANLREAHVGPGEPLDEEVRRGGPGTAPPTAPDTAQTFIRPSKMGTPQGIADQLAAAKNGQTAETTARVEQHKVAKKEIGEEVAAPVAPKDTSDFDAARAEWEKANPDVPYTDTKAISWIARRAQELKTGVADKTIPPAATPDTGSKWQSLASQKAAGETPIPSQKPLQRPPKPEASSPDLRTMTSEDRHEWINKNAPVALQGVTLDQARATARQIFGRDTEVVGYLDNAGRQKYGTKYPVSEAPQTALPSQSEAAGAKEPPQASQTSGTPSNLGDSATKEIEQKFLAAGGQQSLLDSLRKASTDALPKGSPTSSIDALYSRAVTHLQRSFEAGDFAGMSKAFDIASKRSEAGRFTPAGRQVLTPAQISQLSEAHADAMLTKWENFSDEQLKSRDVRKKLTSDEFANTVAATNNPVLETRHNALLERVGHLGADPISALGRLFGGQQLTAGDISRGVLRESLATAARSKDMNTRALDGYIRQWDSRPIHDSIGFIDSIETGNIGGIQNPQDRLVAQRLRDMLDSKRDEINRLGTGKFNSFIENYFPHLWKFGTTDIARQVLSGRRPLAGGAGFLKPRTYEFWADGIEAGLEPVTYNPVQMALLKLHEMDRYLAAHRAFNELKLRGLAAPFEGKDVPDGWVKLNDSMFRAGEKSYYAPADAARPINNHLSPGLRGNALFNSVTAYNNLINQFNLGFSVFHGTETAINSIASEMGLGLQKMSRGDIKGLSNVGASLAAPIRNYILGSHLIENYLDPSRYSQLSHLTKALEQSGGRIAMPPEYKNAARESLRNAWKEQQNAQGFQNLPAAGKLLYRSLGAAMETVSIPLMEKFVPRIKLGTFAREAQDVLDRLPPGTPPDVTRTELGKVWDSIDNRFGQVVYDNLFWNRTAKDIAHLAIRSVGWNMGTIREIGGGVFNLRDFKQPLTGKGLTTKQAYVLALGTMTLGMGAIINAAYGQKPKDLTDYLYPRTGKIGPDGQPERIMVKTYIHDSLAFGHAPGQTTVNKLAPVWNQVANLYNNSDYYGTRIHPVHASTSDALLDLKTYTSTATYLGKSTLPFSIENFRQRRLSGESILSSLSSSAAILPAPKWAGQSPASSLAYELYKLKLPSGGRDPEAVEKLQRYHQLATGYAANQFTIKDLTAALKSGQITSKQFDGILDEEDGKLSPLQRHAKNLSPKEFLAVWNIASKEEKQSLQETLLKKWDTISDSDPKLMQEYNSSYKSFREAK